MCGFINCTLINFQMGNFVSSALSTMSSESKSNTEDMCIDNEEEKSTQVEFAKGDIVKIVGLKSKQHWNDKLATIIGGFVHDKQRWPIQLMHDEIKSRGLLKTENLRLDDTKWLELLPRDLIPLILANFSNRQRCNIATTCKLFNDAIKVIVNNSITIRWDESYNKPIDQQQNERNPMYSQRILNQSDIYSDLHKFENHYCNLLKFDMEKKGWEGSNVSTAFHAKVKDNILYLNSQIFDTRILINDIIDLKWNIINLRKFNKLERFKSKYELGVLIELNISKNNQDPGAWNVGFSLGENRFCFHPSFNGWTGTGIGNLGAARVEGSNGFNNETMGWTPSGHIDTLQTFQIFINQQSHIYLKITEDKNEYKKDWKSREVLFMNKECTILKPSIFGIRVENSKGRNNLKRIAQFGNIYINAGKRNIETNEMSVCEM